MPVQFPSLGNLPRGLSGFLLKLVNAVNQLEVDLRGRLTLEQQLRGRTDAVSRDLREQIETERQAAAEAQAGLRTQLDAVTAARVADREDAEQRQAGLEAAIAAALQFPLLLGGDELRVLTSTAWVRVPGCEDVEITGPGGDMTFVLDVRSARVTAAAGMEGLLRLRNLSRPSAGEVSVQGTTAKSYAFPVDIAEGRAVYTFEGRVSRSSPARGSDGMVIGSATLRARAA